MNRIMKAYLFIFALGLVSFTMVVVIPKEEICRNPTQKYIYAEAKLNQPDLQNELLYSVKLTLCNLNPGHKYYVTSAKQGLLKIDVPKGVIAYQSQFVSFNESYPSTDLVPYPFIKFYLYDEQLFKHVLQIYVQITQ